MNEMYEYQHLDQSEILLSTFLEWMDIIGTNYCKLDTVLLLLSLLDQLFEIMLIASDEDSRNVVGIPDSTAFTTSSPCRLHRMNVNNEVHRKHFIIIVTAHIFLYRFWKRTNVRICYPAFIKVVARTLAFQDTVERLFLSVDNVLFFCFDN